MPTKYILIADSRSTMPLQVQRALRAGVPQGSIVFRTTLPADSGAAHITWVQSQGPTAVVTDFQLTNDLTGAQLLGALDAGVKKAYMALAPTPSQIAAAGAVPVLQPPVDVSPLL